MDEQRFDQLARSLVGILPRRRALSGVAGGALALLLGQAVRGQTLGKRRCGRRRCKRTRVCFKKKCRLIPVAGKRCFSDGLPCRNGAICVATGLSGAEVCVCPAGTSACGDYPDTECVNLHNDPFHCGSCLNRCLLAFTTCCSTGPLEPGECIDPQTDDRHCGRCGRSCGSGERCLGGECVSPCRAGLTNCDGDCVNLNIDKAHCGFCDNACVQNESCVGGQCQPSEPTCVPYGQLCSSGLQCCSFENPPNPPTPVPCNGGRCRFP